MSEPGSEPANRQSVLLYDGSCRFCSRAAAKLARADANRRVRLVDISDPAFDAGAYGLTRAETEAQLHFFGETGRCDRAMDAVRAAYRAAGIGRRLAWTGLPLVRPVFDRVYRIFARHRRRWGRRRSEPPPL